MPDTIRDDIAQRARAESLALICQRQAHNPVVPQPRRSILHRFVAYTILKLFLAFNFLLPYIRISVGVLYRYERRHRISQRIFSAGVNGVDTMGKRGMKLSQVVYGLNDGKVGQAINEIIVWWIQGLTGGIHEGVGEGLSVMNNTRPSPSRKRLSESSLSPDLSGR